ncbi:MAG TPA: phosphatidate cytidylyltransferase [Vicinamibacterales bacterium]|nr:phosphatidate cytidylyltransferase [Vicinamibacterales bacterium]
MTRVLSAIVLLSVVIGTVWFLPPVATLALASAVALLSVFEFARLTAAQGVHIPRTVCAVAVVGACIAVGSTAVPLEVLLLSALIVVGALAVAAGQPGPTVLPAAGASLMAVMYLGLPLGALAAVRLVGGREAVLLLMATLVASDSAQYYTGRAIGRRKLAPSISPAKTVEGAIGGVVFGTAAMTIGGLRVFPAASPVALVLASAAVVTVGMVGDLFESLLKRSAGVKDSSGLIPGHGGVLDRIDSWLFAGPVYYVFTRYLQV